MTRISFRTRATIRSSASRTTTPSSSSASTPTASGPTRSRSVQAKCGTQFNLFGSLDSSIHVESLDSSIPKFQQVNVAGGVLGVEAKHEEKGDNKFVLRQFSRKYTLPEVSGA